MKYKLRELCLEITNQCLLNCLHCSSNAGMGEGYMDKETVFRVIDEFEEMKGEELEISGGEPLTHPDFFEILNYCKGRSFELALYSVGISQNWKKQIQKLPEMVDKVEVSLHGPREVTEEITGADSYNSTKEFINYLVKSGLEVNVHFVPMRLNYLHFSKVLEDCEEMGVKKLKILRLIPQGRAYENWKKLHIPERELGYFLKKISEIKSDVEIVIGNPLRRYLGKEVNCKAGISTSLVRPDGNVYPCPAFKMDEHFSVGNVHENSLKEIWERGFRGIRDFRKIVRQYECIAPWIIISSNPYEVMEQLV